jgi:CrcB protein
VSTALYVAAAGAAGTLCRHLIGVGLTRYSGRFPLGTFTVNVVGSFIIGFVMVMFSARGLFDSRLRVVLTTGFLGGFTTFSAFAFETTNLLDRRDPALTALYIVGTIGVGLLACWLGILSARAIR